MSEARSQKPAGPIRHFTDLIVYRRAFALAIRVFDLSRTWPAEERYALTDQIRRSSRSIGANIAEAWAKRRYAAHWISKLSDADGEAHETEHWLGCAYGMAICRSRILRNCGTNFTKSAACWEP